MYFKLFDLLGKTKATGNQGQPKGRGYPNRWMSTILSVYVLLNACPNVKWLRGQLSSYPIRWMSILQLMAFCNEWLTRESRPFLAEEGRRKCLSIFTHFRVLSMFRYILPFRKLGEIHLDVFSTLEKVTMSMHFFLSSMARKGRGVTWPAECPSSHEENPLMVPEIVLA